MSFRLFGPVAATCDVGHIESAHTCFGPLLVSPDFHRCYICSSLLLVLDGIPFTRDLLLSPSKIKAGWQLDRAETMKSLLSVPAAFLELFSALKHITSRKFVMYVVVEQMVV